MTNSNKIIKTNIGYTPALSRIFIEILSNAVDNAIRSKGSPTPSTYIKININENLSTSVMNDGAIIPIVINEESKLFNHSLIFGKLLTGSNYDDEDERVVAGRNGLGSKCTCIFSNRFEVEGIDPINQKMLNQVWTSNMKLTNGPTITKSTIKKGSTKVLYDVDFSRFSPEAKTDIRSLYHKYIVDSAMICSQMGVKVFYNDVLIESNSLPKYALYFVAGVAGVGGLAPYVGFLLKN